MSQVVRGQTLDVVQTSQRLAETTQPLHPYELEVFLNVCCRRPAFFAEARMVVQEHHFEPGAETPYALLWRALGEITDAMGTPDLATLTGRVLVYLENVDGMLHDDMRNSILQQDGGGLIWASVNTEVADTTEAYARTVMQRFLHERTIVYPLRRMLQHGLNGSYAANIDEFLEAIGQQQGQIQALRQLPRSDVAPDFGSPLLEPADVFKSFDIPCFDRLLDGQRVGDCNGLIGVIGGGKTTTCIHMATAAARQSFVEAGQTGARPEFVIYFTAEESEKKILPKIRSAAFQIPRNKLSRMASWSELTTQANIEPYEHALAINMATNGGPPIALSESERYQMGQPWLRECFELLDVSGSEKFPHAGEGFVDELVANVEALVRMRRGQRIRAVFIDWAGILVKRYMDAIGAKEDSLRHYLTTFIGRCRREIAERYGTTVWVAHQIKTSMITAAPTKLFHHGDASEATSFAAELAVCGCIGVPDKDTGCRRINFSKVRYKPEVEVPPLTVQIHPLFPILVDVSDRYVVNDGQRGFSLASDERQIRGGETASQRVVQSGPMGRRRTAVTDPEPDIEIPQ